MLFMMVPCCDKYEYCQFYTVLDHMGKHSAIRYPAIPKRLQLLYTDSKIVATMVGTVFTKTLALTIMTEDKE